MKSLLITSLCLFLIACSSPSVSQEQTTPPAKTGNSAPLPPPTVTRAEEGSIEERLAAEAQRQAEAYWNKILNRCGDSWFWANRTRGNVQSYECKGEPVFKVDGEYYPPKALTTAETLNGVDPQPVEWRGTAAVNFSAQRVYWWTHRTKGGGEWQRKWEDHGGFWFNLEKKKGKWQIKHSNAPYTEHVRVSCEEIAKQDY